MAGLKKNSLNCSHASVEGAPEVRLFFSNLTFKILARANNGRKFAAREIKMVAVHQPI